jgi:hypothetical protein
MCNQDFAKKKYDKPKISEDVNYEFEIQGILAKKNMGKPVKSERIQGKTCPKRIL